MSFPSKAATARIGSKGVRNEGTAKEEQIIVNPIRAGGLAGPPKAKLGKGNKDQDDTKDAPTVVQCVEEEVKKKDYSHTDHGRDYRERKRDRTDRKKEKTRDRSPVGRKGGGEGRKSRDEAGAGYAGNTGEREVQAGYAGNTEVQAGYAGNTGGRKQQNKAKEVKEAKEDENEREQPMPIPTVRETGRWEGFGWSSRKRNQEQELGRLSSDSDE
eukprot:GFUD01101354.1.p1 GENE.GFUD01101354.1~~GFUD01101354.1.p1  ORF type:complete len:214 (-),score=70.54 GFUD01101354.1:69-710(-)